MITCLIPASAAAQLQFNCAEKPEQLVAEALELGRLIRNGAPDQDRLCAAYAARHGLLGLEADQGRAYADDPHLPPNCRPLNSREYGEELEQFKVCFMQLYQHFRTTRGELKTEPIPAVLDVSGVLSYCLTSGETPQMVWQVRSLQSVLRLSYAAMVTGDKPGLRVCKNCGKVYYNSHAKSEFCSTKCRNYYNVKLFRNRERESS